jgi:hypothetical protein
MNESEGKKTTIRRYLISTNSTTNKRNKHPSFLLKDVEEIFE